MGIDRWACLLFLTAFLLPQCACCLLSRFCVGACLLLMDCNVSGQLAVLLIHGLRNGFGKPFLHSSGFQVCIGFESIGRSDSQMLQQGVRARLHSAPEPLLPDPGSGCFRKACGAGAAAPGAGSLSLERVQQCWHPRCCSLRPAIDVMVMGSCVMSMCTRTFGARAVESQKAKLRVVGYLLSLPVSHASRKFERPSRSTRASEPAVLLPLT